MIVQEPLNAPGRKRWRAPLLIELALLQIALMIFGVGGGYDHDLGFAFIAIVVALVPLGVLCELGVANIHWHFSWADFSFGAFFRGFLLGPVFLLLPFNATFQGLDLPPPAWFPTPHSIWIVVPLAAFFAASWLFGWQDTDKPRSPRARLAETFRADASTRHYTRLVLFIGLGVLQLAVALVAHYREGGLDAGFLSVVVIGSLVAAIVFCETGLTHLGVFDPTDQGAALFFVLVPAYLTPLILLSPAPGWYPTDTSAWILGAWALFACAVVVVEYRYWDAKGRR